MSEAFRILVVDDDESIRNVTAIVLRREGYQVNTAQDGQEAIAKSNAEFYNLALIDIRLPDMEGTKLLSLMPATTPRMMKVIVTGFPAIENAVEAIHNGVDAYLTKPVSTEKLLATVKELLEKQQNENQNVQNKLYDYVVTRLKEVRANHPVHAIPQSAQTP